MHLPKKLITPVYKSVRIEFTKLDSDGDREFSTFGEASVCETATMVTIDSGEYSFRYPLCNIHCITLRG